jgi:trans-aconitate 2-methyltransferase
MTWDPGQYLKYAGERLRPALDLLARVPLAAPATIVDLGCGAGNVTRMLGERWPAAAIVGVDSSAAMLAQAREKTRGEERYAWVEADLAAWRPERAPDLVFSNAALHWLDHHETLLPRLLAAVAPGGALAVQMPDNFGAPSHAALFDLASSASWRDLLGSRVRRTPVAPAADYFGWLVGARSVDIWTTEYLQVLAPAGDGEHPVVAWNKGTALTPFLDALPGAARTRFVAEYAERVAAAYPPRADGRVLFPFRRRFIVALR